MRAVPFIVLLTIIGCGGSGSTTPSAHAPATITIQLGNNQQAVSGTAVQIAPSVIVKDADGDAIADLTVTFTVTGGGGNVSGATPKTDASGVAHPTAWTLGAVGAQHLSAKVTGLNAIVFDATALAVPAGTEPVTAQIPANGGVLGITAPENPLHGLTLTIPPGSYPGAEQWTIQVVPNSSVPTLPSGITQNGAAFSVDGPGRAVNLMTLTVPVTTAAGHHTLLGFYDPARQIMEILPTVANTATTVTVVTTHLDPTLLVGKTSASIMAPFNVTFGALRDNPFGIVIPLDMPALPLPAASTAPQPLWPVPDLPTPHSPSGHGLAITAINSFAKMNAIALQAIKAIKPTNHLADTIAYGTLEILTAKLDASADIPIKGYMAQLQSLPKDVRDGLASDQIAASMSFSRLPLPVGLVQGFLPNSQRAYGSAVASSANSITVSKTADAVSQTIDVNVTGLAAVGSLPFLGGQPFQASGVVPLPSFIVPYEKVTIDLQRFVDGMTAPSDALRQQANDAVAAVANLPHVTIEQQTVPNGPWTAVPNPMVLRKAFGNMRMLVDGVAQQVSMASLPALQEESRVDGIFAVSFLPKQQTAPEHQTQNVMGAMFTPLIGLLQQILPVHVDYIKETFDISPANPTITAANRDVSLTTSVGHPPAEGFRLKWEWGDNTTPTDNLGLTNATHTYAATGTYTVIATLSSNDAAHTVLAADTVMVTTDAQPFWRLTSMTDQDNLFDPDNDAGGTIYDMLVRAVGTPASGLIGVDPTSGGTELFFRVKRTTTWTTCCPPNYSGNDYRIVLGQTPTLVKAFGAAFSVWNLTSWTQTTSDLTTGSMSGKFPFGSLPYTLSTGGTQTGPEVGISMTGTRVGNTLSGVLTFTIWFVGDDGKLHLPDDEDPYRFPFTAVRMQ